MTGITHDLARRYLQAAADDLLQEQERLLLDEHLRSCETCRAEAAGLAALETKLQTSFHARWDRQAASARVAIPNIQKRSRKIFMQNRIMYGFRILTVSVVVLAIALNSIIAQRQLVSSQATPAVTLTLTPESLLNPTPAVQASPNRLIAFTSTESGNAEIFVLNVDGTGLINISDNPAYDGNPRWSPDGSRLAFESDRDGNRNIYVLDLADGRLTRLTQTPGNNVLNGWSPDGSRILLRNDQEGIWKTYTAASDGSAVSHQISADEIQGIVWSADGARIAYVTDNNKGSESSPHIYAVNADGSNRQDIPLPASLFMLEGGMSWASDGKSLFYQASKCGGQGDGCGLPLSYVIYQASPGDTKPAVIASWGGVIADYFVEPSGLTLVGTTIQPTYNTGGIDTWQWVHTDGKTVSKLAQWKNLESDCQNPGERDYASPVGGYSAREGFHEVTLVQVYCVKDAQTWVYSVNIDGSIITKLNKEPIEGDVYDMAWSADGSFLTYSANDTAGSSQFFAWDIQNPDSRPAALPIVAGVIQPVPFRGGLGSTPVSALPAATPAPALPVDSQPGDWIAFSSDKNGGSDIYLIKKDGSGLTNLTNTGGDIAPRWSPDGNTIAFANGRTNIYYDLGLMRADGSDRKGLPPLGGAAAWSPDGKQLADYRSNDPQSQEKGLLHVVYTDGSNPRSFPMDFSNTTREQSFDLLRLRWAADGQHLQFLTLEQPYVQNDVITSKWKIYQLNLEDSSLKVLAESKTQIEDWSGDESSLTVITLEETGWQWLRFVNQKSSVLNTWQPKTGTHYCGYSRLSVLWAPDGKKMLLAANCYDNTTWLFLSNTSGTQISSLADYALNSLQGMSWSPDGTSIVFSSDLEAPGNLDLYLLDIPSALKDPSSRPARLTTSGFSESEPDWQPQP